MTKATIQTTIRTVVELHNSDPGGQFLVSVNSETRSDVAPITDEVVGKAAVLGLRETLIEFARTHLDDVVAANGVVQFALLPDDVKRMLQYDEDDEPEGALSNASKAQPEEDVEDRPEGPSEATAPVAPKKTGTRATRTTRTAGTSNIKEQ